MAEAKAGDDWVDPDLARRLLLEYREKLGVTGGSEIARRIREHTGGLIKGFKISHKTIENRMNNRGGPPTGVTLTILARFFRTEHFQTLVPRARDNLDADARLIRVGNALSDLLGDSKQDSIEGLQRIATIAGWWKGSLRVSPGQQSFLHIVPVLGHGFSKLFVVVRGDEAPRGSGIIWPDRQTSFRQFSYFAARIWAKDKIGREKELKLSLLWPWDDTQVELDLFFKPTNPLPMWYSKKFIRIDENAAPVAIRRMFDKWGENVLPKYLAKEDDFFDFEK